jgi:hypothetical protein
VGGNYAINFQIIDTRDGQPLPPNANNENANILTRSFSVFDFSPPGAGAPPVIQLPTIAANGVYHFNVGSVQGDPNFASVLLPDVGAANFRPSSMPGSNTSSR